MLEDKGRLIALYDPNMGHLSKCLNVGWGLPHPKIQMSNATKYNLTIGNNARLKKNNQNQQKIKHLRDSTAAI